MYLPWFVGAAFIPECVETGRAEGAYEPTVELGAYEEVGLTDPA